MVRKLRSETDGFTSSRSDNSLYNLALKFMRIINKSENKRVDIRFAATELGIHKRRAYDICNILEGQGCLQKITINIYEWIGDDINMILDEFEDESAKENKTNRQVKVALNSNEYLREKEMRIDIEIENIHDEIEKITMDEKNIPYLFITYKDLLKLSSIKNKTAFAVKAPENSYFERGKEKDEHVLQISTNDDKIDVFYIEEDK